MADSKEHTNRLIDETSPYLLQHAHNPVDWYPWGPEALEKARNEEKPILLSIGYSACHWCHVMERESFENEEIAAYMNEHFINIKVDREERPDLDEIYMAATVTLNRGQGGWPMTVFLTPTGSPYFAGTYFPPEDRHGMPGFPTVLERMSELWTTQRDMVLSESVRLADHLRAQAEPEQGGGLGETEIRRAIAIYARDFDSTHGGFGGAPKFPPATGLSLILRYHGRSQDPQALEMVTTTLDAMANGGIYDHIGGGFARYATDETWLVPHFEKMLYDNALLAKVYLEGYVVTGDDRYRRVATETLEWVLREMTDEAGGFHSALDADSEGEEGKFYVWTPDEVGALFGEDDAQIVCEYYDITESGNWEGHGIPNTRRPRDLAARQVAMEPDAMAARVEELRPQLLEARGKRVWPGKDDKVLTAWNGLMIGAFAEGARVLGEPRYLEAAQRAASFIFDALVDDGRLLRTWRAGKAHLRGYLEDYAYLAEGLIDLYEAGGDEAWLRRATELAEAIRSDFSTDENHAFCTTSRGHEELILRRQEGHDGATPNANAVAAHVLARLAAHLGRDDLRDAALDAVNAHGAAIARMPRGFAKSLIAVDLLLEGPVEAVVVGGAEDQATQSLRAAVNRAWLPNRVLGWHDPGQGEPPEDLPLLAGKTPVDGKPALYICRNFTCEAPITDVDAVADALDREQASRASERHTLVAVLTPGRATAEATGAYARDVGGRRAHGYTTLGATGLVVSRFGFGGYRVDDLTDEHGESLGKALLEGINLIDTSTNYTNGRSERLIGTMIRGLVENDAVDRNAVVIVTKVGYMQGDNLQIAREAERAGEAYPEVVKYGDGLWHCIHPQFIEAQLQRSLDRLQLETLDVVLLHNPEYFFADARNRGDTEVQALRDEFYRRMAEAFRYLESQVEAGRIQYYGVSSNTVAHPADDAEATSLASMLVAAQEAAGDDHHFRVLQLPLNLYEGRGVLEKKHESQSVIEVAAAAGIGVLLNRPLNAIVDERLIRLADFDVDDVPRALDPLLDKLEGLEDEFRKEIAGQLDTDPGSISADRFFAWAPELRRMPMTVDSAEVYNRVLNYQIRPHLNEVIHALDSHTSPQLAPVWAAWRDRYLLVLDQALAELRRQAYEKSQKQSEATAGTLDPHLPEESREENLSQKSLWVARSIPGVSTVLVGMRQPAYVDEALGVMDWGDLKDPAAVLAAFADA